MNRNPPPETCVARFFQDLAVSFKTTADLDLYSASRFNVFRSFSPNETSLSDIIRDLLDPQGAHGQGDRFLRTFLQEIGLGHIGIVKGLRPRGEEPTAYATRQRRRIDIFLQLEGFSIGIENKPWAKDQPGWVEHYSNHLKRQPDSSFLLILLTRQGRLPESKEDRELAAILEADRRFRTIYYKVEFKDWLVTCLRDCQAEKVKSFLRDFIDYIPVLEGSGMVTKEQVALVASYVRENPTGNLRVAYAVRQSWPLIVRGIVGSFLMSLAYRMRPEVGDEWEILTSKTEDLLERYRNLLFLSKRSWNRKYAINLVFERSEELPDVARIPDAPGGGRRVGNPDVQNRGSPGEIQKPPLPFQTKLES